MTRPKRLLVVAGEGSGDAFAAPVVARLGVEAFGLGGPALEGVGCHVLVHLAGVAAMGIGTVAVRAAALLDAWRRLLRAVDRERPAAALLVGFSEFNARLGPRLRQRGIRVLWYAPPQIWAWRRGRGARLCRASDAFALILPFEARAWEPSGAPVHYVGHPALEAEYAESESARALAGADADQSLVALLPGSREHEVHTHLPLLLGAFLALRRRCPGLGARVLLASSLDPRSCDWARRLGRSHGIPGLALGMAPVLRAFDLALAVSGTATLEAALAGVPPVIVYRPGLVAGAWARCALLVPWVGLPNLVLEQAAFPELLGRAAQPEAIAERARGLLENPGPARAACHRVREALGRGLDRAPSARVAELVAPWLL